MPGIKAVIPAYDSLTVLYDASECFSALKEVIMGTSVPKDIEKVSPKGDVYYLPVCYEGEFALDWDEVETKTRLTKEEVIRRHTGQEYRVYMMGFLPGFAYLGETDKEILCDRKETPRLNVPKGSVGLAGRQTGVYPSDGPGGWQIIGRTPITIWEISKTEKPLLRTGDSVRFYSIPVEDFEMLKIAFDYGSLNLKKPNV